MKQTTGCAQEVLSEPIKRALLRTAYQRKLVTCDQFAQLMEQRRCR